MKTISPTSNVKRAANPAAPLQRIRVIGAIGAGPVTREDVRRFAVDLLYPVLADRRLTEQILFYRQMATLLKAGIPIYQALALLEERTPDGPLKRVLRESQRQIEAGGKLSEVFARHPETFAEFQVAMLRAGEEGGLLDIMLERAADYVEAEQRLRRFINRQTAYTKIVFIIAQFVLPVFWAFMFGGSVWAAFWYPLVSLLQLVVLVCFAFAFSRYVLSRSEEAALGYERFKWALPGIGSVARSFAFCRFGRSLGALFAAGVPVQAALRVSGGASGSRLVASAAEEMAGYVELGVSLDDACRATGFFPARTVDMIATGAESGRVDTMMLKMADYLEEEAEAKAHQVGYFAAQAFYLLVALYVTGMLHLIVDSLLGLLFH